MVVQKNDWKFCPACKAIVGQNDKTCSKCGYDLMGKTVVSQTTYKEKEVSVPINNVNKSIFIKPLISVLLIIVILVSGFFAYNNILWGDDKIAYDLVLENIFSFKNPSSVRIVSGVADNGSNGEYAFLRLSATNGFGGAVSGYYFLSSLGIMEDEDGNSSVYNRVDKLNIAKINRALERKFN